VGYIRHNAIIVTSWDSDRLQKARDVALGMVPGLVSEIIPCRVNGGGSFFVAPDGSKEGWEDSDEGDRQRGDFIAWLNVQRYEDNSTWLSWAEIAYSADDWSAEVTRHAWQAELKDY
jgi:hypothetical protein